MVSGPNSPVFWIKQCVEAICPSDEDRDKILLGMNFYGYDYTSTGGGPILGRDFIHALKNNNKQAKVNFDDKSKEHFFEFR